MDCSDSFYPVDRAAVLTAVATYWPASTPFLAKCYGKRFAGVTFRMDSGDGRMITWSREVEREEPVRPVMVCAHRCTRD